MTRGAGAALLSPEQEKAERKMRLALIGLAIFTLAGMASPASRALVILLPAISLAMGFYIAPRSMRLYVTLVVWLFMLTPFVRRVVEWHSGSTAITFIMSAPMLAAIAGMVVYRRDWSAVWRYVPRPWIYIVMAVVYALVVGVLSSGVQNVLPGILGWFAPLCFGSYVFWNRDRVPELISTLRTNFLVGLLVTSLYGLYQFFFLAPWDAYWMETSTLTSIGSPFPMEVRVFSTMNAPQPFADFLIFGLLLSVTSKHWLRLVAVPLGVLVLGLTSSRSAWVACACSLSYIILTLTARQRLQIFAVFGGCVLAIGVASLVPEINEMLTQRLQTFTNVKNDGSVNDRLQSQQEAVQMFLSTPFGVGLGGDALLHTDGPSYGKAQLNDVTPADNGIEEVLLTMGWFASIVYIVGFGESLLTSFRGKGTQDTALARAMITAMLIQLPFLGIFPGPSGFLLWTSLALCYAITTAQDASSPQRLPPLRLERGTLRGRSPEMG